MAAKSNRLSIGTGRVDRRTVLRTTSLGAATMMVAAAAQPANLARAQESTPVATSGDRWYAYVGADTRSAAADGADPAELGISVYAVDPDTGALSLIQTVPSDSPFFFDVDPTSRFLYAVNVIGDYEGGDTGSVEAYAIDPETGELTFINRQASGGAVAAQPAVDPTGKFLVVANYNGKNFTVLPINEDGSLEPVISTFEQDGSGPNEARQDMSHPHAVVFDPGGNFIAAADLGTDQVLIFRLDPETGSLEQVSEAKTAPGAGPRHVAFNEDATILYVVNELDATITAFAYDAATGALGEEIQTVSTVPDPFEGTKSTAEIIIHPSGRFLYNTNRGQPDSTTPEGDAVVAWSIDQETGELTLIGHTIDDIDVPWNIVIDETGTWLYAPNQMGSTIVQFEIDQETGELIPTGNITETPMPFAMILVKP